MEKYKDCPGEVKAHWVALQAHMERMAENAQTRLLSLCAASHPHAISTELHRARAFGEELAAARTAVKEREMQLIEARPRCATRQGWGGSHRAARVALALAEQWGGLTPNRMLGRRPRMR